MPMQIGFNEKELMGLNIAIVCGNNGVRCCTIVSAVSLDFLKSKMKVETSFFLNLKKKYIYYYLSSVWYEAQRLCDGHPLRSL